MTTDTLSSPRLKKVAITQRIEESERQLIVGETRQGRSALVEGKFISHRIGNDISIHGCDGLELQDSHVVSMAPASIIMTILINGELEFAYDDLEFHIGPNSLNRITLVNLAQPSSFRRKISKDNNVFKLNIMMNNQWVMSRISGDCTVSQFVAQHKNSLQLPLSDEFNNLVAQAFKLHKVETFLEKVALESIAMQIIELAFSHLESSEIESPKETQQSMNITSIEELICYIEANLSESLSIAELANRFAMSSSNLQRKFKQQVGLTINGYIRKRRLEVAKQHLEKGLVTITEAAYEAGYNHPANFTNAFKKEYGVPPFTISSANE